MQADKVDKEGSIMSFGEITMAGVMQREKTFYCVIFILIVVAVYVVRRNGYSGIAMVF